MTKKNRIKKKHRKNMAKNILRNLWLSYNKRSKLSGKQFPRTRHRNLRKSRIKIISLFKYKFDKIIKNTTYGYQAKYYDLINNDMVIPSVSILSKINLKKFKYYI